jgi:L-fuconolactonase
MRIDSHQHYWNPDLIPYPWMPPAPSLLRRNYLPQDLEPILQANQFDGSIVVQAAQVPAEATWLLNLAAQHKSILGVVAWADLKDPKLGLTLDQLQKNPKFVGIRHIVHDEPDVQWILQPVVLQGLKELERRQIPYDLLIKPPHLPYTPRLLDALPNLPIVIDHIAKPYIKEGIFDGWAKDMERIAKHPKLFCKISGMITEADHKDWKPAQLTPYVQFILQQFGFDRLLFGSDWPVCLLAGSWKEVLAAFTQALGAQNADERAKILGQTAATFYKLRL